MQKLPKELHIHILGYLVEHGEVIKMKNGRLSRETRRWMKEAERLKNPNWKPPKPKPVPGFLEACMELHTAGVKALLGWKDAEFS